MQVSLAQGRKAARLNSGVRFDMKVLSKSSFALFVFASFNALAINPTEPARVIASKASGTAIILVCADKQGRPYDISIVQSSGDKAMDKAVFRAAKTWKFSPVKPDGAPRQECEQVPVELKTN